jgi:hypothetical protein
MDGCLAKDPGDMRIDSAVRATRCQEHEHRGIFRYPSTTKIFSELT